MIEIFDISIIKQTLLLIYHDFEFLSFIRSILMVNKHVKTVGGNFR